MQMHSKIKEITLIGILAAVCVASRMTLTFLPNIKPVTSIIVMVSAICGWKFGVKLSIVMTLVSDMLLGMGIWTFFQVLAWCIISIIAGIAGRKGRCSNIVLMTLLSGFSGYLFGFIVSFEKLILSGFWGGVAYYLSGLPFDTLHAVGNLVFYPICYYPMKAVFVRYLNKEL